MGGLFTRWYQYEHPDQVVGMVLVDTYETTAPVNGKQVPLYTLTEDQLQANLPPPSSLTTENTVGHQNVITDQNQAVGAGPFYLLLAGRPFN
jgi:pimeloyl-ACP methyl ester carboxylesterase